MERIDLSDIPAGATHHGKGGCMAKYYKKETKWMAFGSTGWSPSMFPDEIIEPLLILIRTNSSASNAEGGQ